MAFILSFSLRLFRKYTLNTDFESPLTKTCMLLKDFRITFFKVYLFESQN